LQITISGEVGSGRTTLALAIGSFLADLGMSIQIADEDIGPQTRPDSGVQARRVEQMRGRQATVETVQLRRDMRPVFAGFSTDPVPKPVPEAPRLSVWEQLMEDET
jgi:pantothenate kinase-related protein Tda10